MFTAIQSFIRDEAGIAPIEYGLITAIVVVLATAAASAAGYNIHDLLGTAPQN
ncbi:MAG: Flp family type IVb pilin [Candidatus Devosia symbiotica]|nr:Flp family type IVb pilin [Candidatus Devosia symbiotica]